MTAPLALGSTALSADRCTEGTADGADGGAIAKGITDVGAGPLAARLRDNVVPGTVSPTGRMPGGSSKNV
jgi:hypothetical protein